MYSSNLFLFSTYHFLNNHLNGYFPGACNWDDTLWLLPRGSVVMFFGIICYKIMFFIVCIVLSSSSSPQSRDLDFQSIPQLNSLLGYFSSLFFSPHCALKWKSSGLREINENNDLWNFHLLVGRDHSIGSHLPDFRNFDKCRNWPGFQNAHAWGKWEFNNKCFSANDMKSQFYSHMRSQVTTITNTIILSVCIFKIGWKELTQTLQKLYWEFWL